MTHLNFRLGVMKATQPLSDKSIENEPNKAATWFLNYEKSIESILRLGERTTLLGMQCFNASTIHKISKRLPYTIQYQTYELKEDGREKLEKIIDMVTKARTNAEKRATDKNNQSPDITMVSSEVNVAQNEPDTTSSLPEAHQDASRGQQYTTGWTKSSLNSSLPQCEDSDRVDCLLRTQSQSLQRLVKRPRSQPLSTENDFLNARVST